MIFFTSDTHFWHTNIIHHSNRPFKTVEEMNQGLIDHWNTKVKEHDEVYHLGDFAFAGRQKAVEILNQLNGRKYWVYGNHDKSLRKNEVVSSFFEWVKPLTRIRIKQFFNDVEYDKKIVLCHFPLISWEGMSHGTWHLHGHCHGTLEEPYRRGLMMDVGVDTTPTLSPYSFLEVEEFMADRSFRKVDHHGN